MNNEQRKLRIHISYVPEDTSAVRKLYNKLKVDGFQPWMDRMDLLPGQDWNMLIRQSIIESDVIIACLSRNSYQKEGHIQSEYKFIDEITREKPKGIIFLIPVRLEDCDIPDIFRPYQRLDYFQDADYEKLRMSLLARAEELGISVTPVGKSKSTQQNKTSNKTSLKSTSNTVNQTSIDLTNSNITIGSNDSQPSSNNKNNEQPP